MYIHYSRRMVLANAPPFTSLLVTPKQHSSLKTNRHADLGKGGESRCHVRGSFQSQITRTITIHFLPFTANGSLITPITFTYSLQSRELWPLRVGMSIRGQRTKYQQCANWGRCKDKWVCKGFRKKKTGELIKFEESRT